MRKWLLLLLVLLVPAGAYLFSRRNRVPEVPFTKVAHETVVSTLTTNGKVEPLQYAVVRTEREGTVLRTLVDKGQHVTNGQLLVELDAREAQTDLASAKARIAQVQAELDTQKAGGRAPELAEIESGLAKAQAEKAAAQRDLDTNLRLKAKGAATQLEVNASQQLVDQAQLQIDALNRRRGSLVSKPDLSATEARLRDANATAIAAQRRIDLSEIHSTIDGTVYQFDLRPGAYLNPGDVVASIGRLDRLRVLVYVDEPELGRVQVGMPVTITWGALPGKQWNGTVEKVPTQVQPLGSRQVGEVSCIIENEGNQLLPGTNVDAAIRSAVAPNTMTIPRECLRKENGQTGVYTVDDHNLLQWRQVKVGIASITRVQITAGLREGEPVALPSDRILHSGDLVTPTYP